MKITLTFHATPMYPGQCSTGHLVCSSVDRRTWRWELELDISRDSQITHFIVLYCFQICEHTSEQVGNINLMTRIHNKEAKHTDILSS